MGDFTEELLEALENKKVRKRIREIAGEEEKKVFSLRRESEEKWKKEADQLRRLLEQERTKAEGLAKLLDRERAEKEHLSGDAESERRKRSQIEEELSGLRRIAEDMEKRQHLFAVFKERYGRLDYYYERYLGLGDEIHKSLDRILSAASPEEFLCRGVQWGNIEMLWESMDTGLSRGQYTEETFVGLEEIFDYFFELHRNMTGTYERLDTKAGEEFDSRFHKRSGDSQASGRISRVLLRGYRGITNKKIQPSIVRI